MERTLYEVLGVQRDATEEQIRAAARRAASAAHPDREGGSTDAMQAVNAARDVLLDPQRRARYDETGATGQAMDLDEIALEELANAFRSNLDHQGNLIAKVRGDIKTKTVEARLAARNAERKTAALQARRQRIKAKKGENLVHRLIDEELVRLDCMVRDVEQAVQVLERMQRLLDAYESDEQDPDAGSAFISAAFHSYWSEELPRV